MVRMIGAIRSSVLALVLAPALLVLPGGAAAASGAAPAAYSIQGGGSGHGVGMSQWGAYGMALRGRTTRSILAHYYPGDGGSAAVSGGTLQRLLGLRSTRFTVTPAAGA
jgi:peptidoglycan hydrolase-like amidase